MKEIAMSTLPVSRRQVMRGAALGAGAALVGGRRSARAQALHDVIYVTPFGNSVAYTPDYVAAGAGLFEKNGLKVKIVGGTGSAAAVQQVVAGQALVARAGGIDVVRAISQSGASMRAIGTIAHTSTWHVVSAAAAPVHAPAELAGKTVGIVSAGGGTENTLDIMLASAGVPHDAVKRQVVGNSPGAFDLVRLKRLDAFICDAGVVLNLRQRDAAMFVLVVDPFVAVPGQVYVASQKAIDTQADLLLGYLRAVRAAMQQIAADTSGQETLKLLGSFDLTELHDPATALGSIREEQKLWEANGPENLIKIIPGAWAKGWQQMVASGLATAGDPTRCYTTALSDKL
jgi:NitT/TauT family transport system substrate-binding protein